MKKTSFVLCVFFVCTATAFANAIVPVFHFFNSFLVIPSILLLLIVIVIEAVLLRVMIRPVGFLRHLWVAWVVNVISGVVGSLLGLILHFSFTLLDIYWSSLVITLGVPFGITVLTEYPAIRLLYKSLLTRRKAILTAMEINVISYIVFCFLITPFYLTGIMTKSRQLDQQRLEKWNHNAVFNDEVGFIYKLSNSDKHYILKRYDVGSRTWQEVYRTDERECRIGCWDISNAYFVFSDYLSGQVQIVSNHSFDPVCKLNSTGRCVRLKISPSQQYVSILENAGEVRVRKKDNGWFQLAGRRALLSVFQTDTGQQLAKYERPVLEDTLSWSPDSKKILFETLETDSVLLRQDSDASEIYLREYPAKAIGWYDFLENKFAILGRGQNARWNPQRDEILFANNGDLNVLDLETTEISSFAQQAITDFEWSPSGAKFIGLIRTENPMWTNKYFLTVIDKTDPSKRYIIDTDEKYSFVWISGSSDNGDALE